MEGLVSDPDRVAYFRDYLHAASLAIEDRVNLKGYFAWSLLDNFDWLKVIHNVSESNMLTLQHKNVFPKIRFIF